VNSPVINWWVPTHGHLQYRWHRAGTGHAVQRTALRNNRPERGRDNHTPTRMAPTTWNSRLTTVSISRNTSRIVAPSLQKEQDPTSYIIQFIRSPRVRLRSATPWTVDHCGALPGGECTHVPTIWGYLLQPPAPYGRSSRDGSTRLTLPPSAGTYSRGALRRFLEASVTRVSVTCTQIRGIQCEHPV